MGGGGLVRLLSSTKSVAGVYPCENVHLQRPYWWPLINALVREGALADGINIPPDWNLSTVVIVATPWFTPSRRL